MIEIKGKYNTALCYAKVVEAEAEVPQALAAALREGRLGVMDYYNMENILSDTKMRNAISESGDTAKPTAIDEEKPADNGQM